MICALFAGLAPCAGETLSGIVPIADFEPPSYTAGTSFHSVDGWTNLVATGVSKVTPDGGDTGVATVLDGTQSAVLTSSVRFSMGRGWGSGSLPISDSAWVLRGVLAQLTPGGQSEFWLSSTAGVGGASTIAGLVFHSGGMFRVLDDVAEVDTGVPWTEGHAYLVDLVFDVPADRYDVIVEDLTGGTGRQALATGLTIGGGAGPPAVINLINNGGVLVVDDGVGSRTVFDTILLASYQEGPDAVAATEVDLDDVPVFTFSGEAGEVYRLQGATDPAGGAWTDLPYLIEGTGSDMTAYDPAGPGPHRIYRVVALPPTFVERKIFCRISAFHGHGTLQLHVFPCHNSKQLVAHSSFLMSFQCEFVRHGIKCYEHILACNIQGQSPDNGFMNAFSKYPIMKLKK